MRVYFNGCSHTYGDELKNPVSDSWPSLVSAELSCSFTNDAVTGGTNERIVYNTVSNLNNYDFFIIAWTDYARFTEYNPADNYEINFNPGLNLDTSLHSSNDLKDNYAKYKDYGTLYYKHWYNDLYAFKQWLQQIILLQNLFENNNKSYIMLNSTRNNLDLWLSAEKLFISHTKHLLPFFNFLNDQQILNFSNDIKNLVSSINTSTFVEWNNWYITKPGPLVEFGPGGHLLEEGQKQVAKKVIQTYNILV